MSKKTKIWLVMATSLVVIGLIMFTAVMLAYNWDFTKLSTEKYEMNTYEISKEFSSISMNTDTADILFVTSDDDTCRVVCYEEEKVYYPVTVKDGILTINMVDERKWYEYIGINFAMPKVTVYLPGTKYGELHIKGSTGDIEIPKDFRFEDIDISVSTGDVANRASVSNDVKIETSTGAICVENVSARKLYLSVSTGNVIVSNVTCEDDVKIDVSTGDVQITDVRCNSIFSTGDTGDINLNNTVATKQISIDRSTGDVTFEKSDATELFIKTDTGDVIGDLLTDKVFIIQTDTGDIDVPKTTIGGKCEIITDTGDINIRVL